MFDLIPKYKPFVTTLLIIERMLIFIYFTSLFEVQCSESRVRLLALESELVEQIFFERQLVNQSITYLYFKKGKQSVCGLESEEMFEEKMNRLK